ncbi:putative cytochrome P450 CYP13A1 [Solenopsis invicta]|uniref:putative cytochrome P450 CYP13A1 n=1 Tax=Solenopsis invicta TaxID=13686 RepID=UPI00193E3983|nr:putative cytochrome P450 CYP13A1 [Solenopsis invicta]
MARVIFRRMSMAEHIQSIYNLFPDEKYVGFYDFTRLTFIIRDPKIISKITIKCFDNFCNHRSVVNESTDLRASRNLVSLQEHHWREMRTLLSPTFSSGKIKMINFPPFAKLLKLRMIGPKIVNFFKDIVTNVVKARDDQGIVCSDMIQLMMKTRDKNSGPEFDINEMTAQAFVFFVTGFAVVNETLRLYQEVAFINRICVTETELPPGIPNGEPITIKPGNTVRFPFALMEAKVILFYQLWIYDLKPDVKTKVPLVINRISFTITAERSF